MDKKDLKFIFAPIGVAFGVSLFIFVSIFISEQLGVRNLSYFISIPESTLLITGALTMTAFFPFFVLGIFYLNRRGAVGQSGTLVKNGVYKYVRNPMYVGLSSTIFGAGLLLNDAGLALAGIFWAILSFVQCIREEGELTRRFGREYVDYKLATPRFIPNFYLVLKDLLKLGEAKKAEI